MNNFFCNHKTQKSDPEHTFSEIDINYRRDYSKGKSFKVSIWNEIDTYNNDDFIQDFVIYNQSLWARIDSTPSTNEVPTEGPWTKVMDGVSDVQFKEDGNKIFWKYEDESEWKDLFELDVVSESEIKNMLKDIATDVDSNFYDKTLSETSVNAVQNKVITQALNKKADKTELSKKQDVISDLSEIRNKAKSALQSVPSEYITESELANKGYLTEHQDISGKQDKIADLAQIRANAQKGATALQTVPSEYATKTDVSNEVAKIVNSAPKAFDTLKEIADWIEEDAEPAIVLANKVEQKVDKVEGLGLSEENYTADDKAKLAGLENYDDSEIKEDLAKKADKSEIPTKMSQLEQDIEVGSGYDDTEIKQEIAELAEKMGNISPTPMVSVTYAELVELRNNGGLVAGMQYRITDYVTTTTQENTRSAGHQFDIIVTADNENTLNEVARACRSEFDIEKYKDAYSGSSEVKMLYVGLFNHEGKEYHLYESESHNLQMLVDFNSVINLDFIYTSAEYPYSILPLYTRWNDEGQWGGWYDGRGEGEDIVFKHNPAEATYFNSSNLAAWQIWYSLDNDIERFVWAKDLSVDTYDSSECNIKSELIDGNIFITPLSFSGYMWNDPLNGEEYDAKVENDLVYEWGFEEEPNGSQSLVLYKSDVDIYVDEGVDYGDKFFYRGVVEVDGEEYDYWQKCEKGKDYNIGAVDGGDSGRKAYALTERIVEGDIIHISYTSKGNGVIYRMIDEWGNECPYDFKNIQFKRGIYAQGKGIANINGDEDFNVFCYTFSWEDEERIIMDSSIFGNNGFIVNDEGIIPGVFGNIIKPCMTCEFVPKHPRITTQQLNDIVFLDTYGYDGGIFYGCIANTFGNNCRRNNFNSKCKYNTLGNNCLDNYFEKDCGSNTLGDNCNINVFGEGCSDNVLGDMCISNVLGNYSSKNTFGPDCYDNRLGESCEQNSFGISCYINSLGNTSRDNSFGNHCYTNIVGFNFIGNTLGNECRYNEFGDQCQFNNIGNECSFISTRRRADNTSELIPYCRYIKIDDGCSYLTIYPTPEGEIKKHNNIQNLHIKRGVFGNSSNYIYIGIDELSKRYEKTIAYNSKYELKQYCEADLIQ